ncbi:hypothetical protein PFISCL1PPCAC_1023, partial [Pristionchus fissidentatus]
SAGWWTRDVRLWRHGATCHLSVHYLLKISTRRHCRLDLRCGSSICCHDACCLKPNLIFDPQFMLTFCSSVKLAMNAWKSGCAAIA